MSFFTPRNVQSDEKSLPTNWAPLSGIRESGMPNGTAQCLRNISATRGAVSSAVSMTLVSFEWRSVMININALPLNDLRKG